MDNQTPQTDETRELRLYVIIRGTHTSISCGLCNLIIVAWDTETVQLKVKDAIYQAITKHSHKVGT